MNSGLDFLRRQSALTRLRGATWDAAVLPHQTQVPPHVTPRTPSVEQISGGTPRQINQTTTCETEDIICECTSLQHLGFGLKQWRQKRLKVIWLLTKLKLREICKIFKLNCFFKWAGSATMMTTKLNLIRFIWLWQSSALFTFQHVVRRNRGSKHRLCSPPGLGHRGLLPWCCRNITELFARFCTSGLEPSCKVNACTKNLCVECIG